MQYDITIDYGREQEFHYAVSVDPTREAIAEAQAWLDAQFVELGSEPLRPTGKVLTADKVLVIAIDASAKRFRDDAAWAERYARSAALALNRAVIRVNTVDRIVGY